MQVEFPILSFSNWTKTRHRAQHQLDKRLDWSNFVENTIFDKIIADGICEPTKKDQFLLGKSVCLLNRKGGGRRLLN